MTTAPEEKKNTMRRPWRFKERWRIEGVLFTESPLHIGAGTTTHHPALVVEDKPAQVSAVIKDHTGRPLITGTGLKGCLRAWADACMSSDQPDLVREVFGKPISHTGPESREKNELSAVEGGSAEFHDAPLAVVRTGETPLPLWDDHRQLYIQANNSIDRHTRTAADKHLLHTECVPAGVGFDVVITGNFSEQAAAFILYLLNSFNDEKNSVCIGADTRNGKGRCRWEQGRLYRMDKAAVKQWLTKENRDLAENDMPRLPAEYLAELQKRFPIKKCEDPYALDIALQFESHFLVNDPLPKSESGDEKDAHTPDMRPRVDEMNEVILPATSFRGAFRSQAEKILRTLGVYCCNVIAPCDGIDKTGAIESLCPACRLFGATGWASLVSVSDFRLVPGDYEFTDQEFVAIDRFTGGGCGSAKFTARAIYKPRFNGKIQLDLQRLANVPSPGENAAHWAVALLALTMRDLKEGDITFGYGAAKGYGACTWDSQGSIWDEDEFKQEVRNAMPAFKAFIAKEANKSIETEPTATKTAVPAPGKRA